MGAVSGRVWEPGGGHLSVPDSPALESSTTNPKAAATRVLSAGAFGRNDWTVKEALVSPDSDTLENESLQLIRTKGVAGETGTSLDERHDRTGGEENVALGQLDVRVGALEREKKLGTGNVLDDLPPEAWEPCHWCRNESVGGGFSFSSQEATCPGREADANGQPYRIRGFIIPETTGGLNQIRRYICNAVGLAHLLHAALVLPRLQADVFWKDGGAFEDVFDVDHFIGRLRGVVPVVRELPKILQGLPPTEIKVSRFDKPSDYVRWVLPVLQRRAVIKLRARFGGEYEPGFDHFEQARCRACFGAFKFVDHVAETGELLLARMREKGRFAALHLRFEPDMVAFSRCDYPDLLPASADVLQSIRSTSRKFNKRKQVEAAELRRQGLCPLTPAETAKVFLALGIPTELPVYLATGDFLEPEGLTSVYRNTFRKSDLLTKAELEPYGGRANLLVALDFYVATRSDYFLATFYSNVEQMVVSDRTLSGRRHSLILNRTAVAEAPAHEGEWPTFKAMMLRSHLGEQVTVQAGQVPEKLPYCMCPKRTSSEGAR
ncbi:O-fucosyltransferase family protein [Klebsormidium nitens]|uniref:O-fucosyltransferase family protein n=1 Tax=Klebsormidium nitens TaxID=105231 RepID=A0A1Y1HYX5_KLENI|nr:O-fucosyltransferase family protein [Klebsormidium nitens]|eukprot:GAQ83393.1 O-fucosyltransferase family protein [Klebsormidium nitens]